MKMKRFLRIAKLRLQGYKNCEGCGKFTNKIYSIPYIEAGLLVCKRCDELDLKN
jgi:ribosome-binding protein aMBF1 (putative translation factor)